MGCQDDLASRIASEAELQIDRYGTSISYHTLSAVADDTQFGTQTLSYADSTIKAIVADLKSGDKFKAPGIIVEGDLRLTVKGAQAAKVRDTFTLNSIIYEVISVTNTYVMGTIVTRELIATKKPQGA